ncbi:MAG: cardiolipin synthase [Propioniciclava sp.]|uniref:cardiolipin synthase n=1 Tax=Propioniciclava sp. TaxID=2038686 RepID=UPI0039E60290
MGADLVWTWAGVAYVIDLAIRIVALGVVPRNRRPASGVAWLLAIVMIPYLGLVLFLLLGRTDIGRKRDARQRLANARVHEVAPTIPAATLPAGTPDYVHAAATLNTNLGSLPMRAGNRVELIPGYQQAIEAIAAEIDRARRFVHVQYYITAWDHATAPVYEALVRATERGVKVRLLVDHVGTSRIPGYRRFERTLNASGIEWYPMMPVRPLRGDFQRPDLRNHRKIVVVDGTVAFTGSQNLIEPSYGKPKHQKAGRRWVELVMRCEGPLVETLDVVFATDWLTETGEVLIDEIAIVPPERGEVCAQVIPSGPGVVAENNLRAFVTLIANARHRVSLVSPYFVPDESLLYAVTTAALRGVEVELFVSEGKEQFMVFHAQRSYYEELLRHGVRIWLYPEPFVLHTKCFTVDDDVAVIGSSNMDMRSFALNFEVSVLLTGGDVVAQTNQVIDGYRALSRELVLQEWLTRPLRHQYLDNVLRLTAALQ